PMLNWLVEEKGIEPHIPVFDKSGRSDGSFERADFTYDHQKDVYICPGGKALETRRRNYPTPKPLVSKDGLVSYRASKHDCSSCTLKARCCPRQPHRKVLRSVYENARQMARDIAKTDAYEISCKLRKKVEMLFAHLKRILRLGRLRLRGPCGARDEFHLAAAAQNLRKLAKLIPTNATAAA
ncbi:MAG: transposase, partial [Pseudomonadota bacterium]